MPDLSATNGSDPNSTPFGADLQKLAQKKAMEQYEKILDALPAIQHLNGNQNGMGNMPPGQNMSAVAQAQPQQPQSSAPRFASPQEELEYHTARLKEHPFIRALTAVLSGGRSEVYFAQQRHELRREQRAENREEAREQRREDFDIKMQGERERFATEERPKIAGREEKARIAERNTPEAIAGDERRAAGIQATRTLTELGIKHDPRMVEQDMSEAAEKATLEGQIRLNLSKQLADYKAKLQNEVNSAQTPRQTQQSFIKALGDLRKQRNDGIAKLNDSKVSEEVRKAWVESFNEGVDNLKEVYTDHKMQAQLDKAKVPMGDQGPGYFGTSYGKSPGVVGATPQAGSMPSGPPPVPRSAGAKMPHGVPFGSKHGTSKSRGGSGWMTPDGNWIPDAR